MNHHATEAQSGYYQSTPPSSLDNMAQRSHALNDEPHRRPVVALNPNRAAVDGPSSIFANASHGLTGDNQRKLAEYWQKTITDIETRDHDFKSHALPLARIKKVMKADEEVKMISAEAPILFSKGCEIFITELTMRAWIHAEENKRRTLQRSDIANAISRSDMFDFLIDIVPREEFVAGSHAGAADGGDVQPVAGAAGGYMGMAIGHAGIQAHPQPDTHAPHMQQDGQRPGAPDAHFYSYASSIKHDEHSPHYQHQGHPTQHSHLQPQQAQHPLHSQQHPQLHSQLHSQLHHQPSHPSQQSSLPHHLQQPHNSQHHLYENSNRFGMPNGGINPISSHHSGYLDQMGYNPGYSHHNGPSPSQYSNPYSNPYSPHNIAPPPQLHHVRHSGDGSTDTSSPAGAYNSR